MEKYLEKEIPVKFIKLEKNIIEVLKEEQVKLGYRSETVRLYYPLQSLNRFLNTHYKIEEMRTELERFSQMEENKLGRIEILNDKDRFCLMLPPQASDYVHEHTSHTEFIFDFVNTISKHGVTMDEVLEQFYKYSDHVHVDKVKHGEFDYLVYFEDGVPDEFRYCITDEGGHIIYHRFTEEDYKDFYLESNDEDIDLTIETGLGMSL